jgi:hypothetical protein
MGAVDLDVAVGSDDHESSARQISGEVDQEIERAPVRVVQVLEDDQEGLDRGGVAEELAHRLEQTPAIVVGISRRPQLDGHTIADLGHQSGDVGRAGPEVLAQPIWVTGEYVRAHGFDKR